MEKIRQDQEVNQTEDQVIQQHRQSQINNKKASGNFKSKQGQLPPIQTKQGNLPPIRAKQRPIPAKQKPIQSKHTIVQRKRSDNGNNSIGYQVDKPNDTGLPDRLKAGTESLSGYSMDDVKVHYNSDKPAQLQAHAYAQGTDIHLAPGQEQHLPHEAWHVIQQKQGRVKPTIQLKEKANINDDVDLEKEADVMGSKALESEENIQRLTAGFLDDQSNIQRKTITDMSSQVIQRVFDREQKKRWRNETSKLIGEVMKDMQHLKDVKIWLMNLRNQIPDCDHDLELMLAIWQKSVSVFALDMMECYYERDSHKRGAERVRIQQVATDIYLSGETCTFQELRDNRVGNAPDGEIVLFHYTDDAGATGIDKSKEIWASTRDERNATNHGFGVYLTCLSPEDAAQHPLGVSGFTGLMWGKPDKEGAQKMFNYVKVKVPLSEVVKVDHNTWLMPGNTALNGEGKILDAGKTSFGNDAENVGNNLDDYWQAHGLPGLKRKGQPLSGTAITSRVREMGLTNRKETTVINSYNQEYVENGNNGTYDDRNMDWAREYGEEQDRQVVLDFLTWELVEQATLSQGQLIRVTDHEVDISDRIYCLIQDYKPNGELIEDYIEWINQ